VPRAPRLAGGGAPALGGPGDPEVTNAVRRLMWEKAGVVRGEAGLGFAVEELERLAARHPRTAGEARNLLSIGRLVAAAALERRESRGGHYRSDFPATDPAWRRRLFLTAAPDGSAHFETAMPQRVAAGSRRS
jgi:L-aspartate oxidase